MSEFARERGIDLPSGHLGYHEVGKGTPLLLLHGISSGALSWSLVADHLASRYRVIAWDAPGYASSAALATATPQASDYARVLLRLVEDLELSGVVLVGHSLGAMMAAAFAQAHSSRVAGVLLADPAQGYANADAWAREQARDARVHMLSELGAEKFAEQRAPGLLRAHPQTDALETVRAGMRRLRIDGYAQACAMLAEDDIWSYLPTWQGPRAVLCGAEDRITPPDAVELLAARIGASCTLIPDAGHASYLDQPERFAAQVDAFARDAVASMRRTA